MAHNASVKKESSEKPEVRSTGCAKELYKGQRSRAEGLEQPRIKQDAKAQWAKSWRNLDCTEQ